MFVLVFTRTFKLDSQKMASARRDFPWNHRVSSMAFNKILADLLGTHILNKLVELESGRSSLRSTMKFQWHGLIPTVPKRDILT